MLLLLASTAAALLDDEPCSIDFVESGGIDFAAFQALAQSAAMEQLRDICDAMQKAGWRMGRWIASSVSWKTG